MIGFRAGPKFLFSRGRMKVIRRFLDYQKREFQRIKLGVFELALLSSISRISLLTAKWIPNPRRGGKQGGGYNHVRLTVSIGLW